MRWEGVRGEKERRVFRNMDTWTKPKRGRIKGGEWGCLLYTSDAADDPRVV